MMSSDQNVRILERLVRNLKRYVDLKLETLRLDAVSRITMLLSAILIGVVFFCLASLVAIMLSFAAVVYLAPLVGGYVVSRFGGFVLRCGGVAAHSLPQTAHHRSHHPLSRGTPALAGRGDGRAR